MTYSKRYMKEVWYPRPHDMHTSWVQSLYRTGGYEVTAIPLIMYDEGLGAPSSYNANPEHASFAEYDGPNCYPESKVYNIKSKVTIALTNKALETDKLPAVRVGFNVFNLAFSSDYDAKDELSGLTIANILKLQKEDTDRQGYPLFNGVKNTEKFTNSALLGTDVPGLTTTQIVEFIELNFDTYYDCINYGSNRDKLRNVQHGWKNRILTENNPVWEFYINQKSKTKFMNPYTLNALAVAVYASDTHYQIPEQDYTTLNSNHVSIDVQTYYEEWNRGFNMERV